MLSIRKKRVAIFLVMFLCVLSIQLSWGQSPKTISYQGVLTDSAGTPVDGSRNLTFKIYDAETEGTALWTEPHTKVEISKGVFSVILGDPKDSADTASPLNLPFDKPYWLEITVDTTPLEGRIPLTAAPYTLNAPAGANVHSHSATGVSNTATGESALKSNTTGGNNTATGSLALINNTTGSANTATGRGALLSNTTDHSLVIGRNAAILWDIYDGVGWESAKYQYTHIPDNELFFDGISDPDLVKVKKIINEKNPHSLIHGTLLGELIDSSPVEDSFVYYWLTYMNFGQEHHLKTILFNNGIQLNPGIDVATCLLQALTGNISPQCIDLLSEYVGWKTALHQNPPIIRKLEHTSDSIHVTVAEIDVEDQANFSVDLYVNGSLQSIPPSSTGWVAGTGGVSTNRYTFVQDFAQSEIFVVVNDGMEWDQLSPFLPLIDSIADGQTLSLTGGVYTITGGVLNFQGKSVVLESSSGANVRIQPENNRNLTITNYGGGIATIKAGKDSKITIGQ